MRVDLRGLNINGRCPECGTAVGYRAQGDYLRYSDPTWLDTLRRGTNFILWAIVVAILSFVASALAGRGGSDLGAVLKAGLTLVFFALNLVGTWLVTTPDPSGLGEETYGVARRVIRVTLLLGAADTFLDFVQEIITMPPVVHLSMKLFGMLALIASLVGTFAFMQYLAKLAMRMPDRALSARANFLKWAFLISFGLVFLVAFLAALTSRADGAAGSLPSDASS